MCVAVVSMRTGSVAIGVGSMSISWSYAWSSGMGWWLDISVRTKVCWDKKSSRQRRMSSLVVPNAGLKNHHVGLPVYLRGEEQAEKKREEEVVRRRNGFCLGRKEVAAESSESSSIGAASSSSEEEVSRQEGREAKEEEEVESKRKDGAALGSNIRSASYTSLSSRDHTVQEADEEEEDHKR
ncbi:hypothetical protein GW17_00045072 [Ensete ventricosum]|nr:hypothetical protein GW17_00045072 [Ensete ventricosum]